ncbi:MAG: hypothetical protein V3T83_10635 [Acidobacteriota bacterium]
MVGARPNLMKAAPVVLAMADRPEFEQALIHTRPDRAAQYRKASCH